MPDAFILLVESDKESRDAAIRALEQDGHRLVHVDTGAAALAHFKATPFDLVVWGVGSSAASDVSQIAAASRGVPILWVQPARGAAPKLEDLPAGTSLVLVRPVDHVALRMGVARILEQQLLLRDNLRLKSALARAVPEPSSDGAGDSIDADWPTLETLESRYVDRVLVRTGGNRTAAANVLGVNRRTLQRLFARRSRAS